MLPSSNNFNFGQTFSITTQFGGLEIMTDKIYTIYKVKRLFMKRRKTYGKYKKRFSYKNKRTQKRK